MKHHLQSSLLPLLIFSCLLAALLSPAPVFGQGCRDWVAKVVSVQGKIFAQKAGTSGKVPVRLNDIYSAGDTLFVGEKSRLGVMLCNDAILRFDQNSTLTFSGMEREWTTLLDLIRGAVHFFSRTPRGLKVATPYVNGSVEGTEFFVKVDVERKETYLSIFEGKVLAEGKTEAGNAGQSLLLAGGESAVTRLGKAPRLVTVVHPRDAVQWAIHYPPILSYRGKDFAGATDWKEKVRRSIHDYWKGRLTDAFQSLAGISNRVRDPKFFVYRAGLLLSVGRVDAAQPDIEQALALDAKMSEAVALKAVIALVRNDKEKAMELAHKAAAMDARSSVARVALSYVQQAHFDLEGALKSLEEATRLDPENAFAWARLSEVWQSLGYLDRSLTEAKKAISVNPTISRTQSVLGFAYLTQIKIEESIDAFEKAILLDQAAPLPRLGLGLAKIRDGRLIPGRREIEIAAALDPNNAMIRSYLGKAFYEEKRDGLDRRELNIAKKLDPNDPTPYFYDAIRLQSVNRPVEALKNIQKSIEKNNNRAVYRSKLLLDQDLAARSASLGRIYRDLGFEQIALVEGWKSVNTDPANFSGHRFLADTYSALPRHEIARVSELLQSQLLQPININPVQPSLAESDSLILSGAGPTDPAFNEFNPLFNRNRMALQANFVGGQNDTVGDDFVLSGVKDRFSLSAGQNFYETDGFRENNDLKRQLYNVFAQASITPQTSIQAEYRYSDQKNGDLSLGFDPTFFQSNRRERLQKKIFRGGLRHRFNPHSDLITSIIYQNLEGRTEIQPVIEDSAEEDAYIFETQHLFKYQWIHFTSGFGYFNSDATSEIKFFQNSLGRQDLEAEHTNIYSYSRIHYPEDFVWTIGASGDFMEGRITDVDQFNPKFGMSWNLPTGTSLRAAVFRVLNRTLISKMTLEPTQVAGFNQFFDDDEGTMSWRYGVGLDQKINETMFAGIEFTKRDLDVPYINLNAGGIVAEANEDETLGRAYFYWTPKDWMALSAEYQYERIDGDRFAPREGGVIEAETHRIPLKLNLFSRLGFFLRLNGTYIHQDGEFSSFTQGVAPGKDEFWVLDLTLGYRFPKRFGLLTVEGKNIFDEEFHFQDTDPANPGVYPDRSIYVKFALSL